MKHMTAITSALLILAIISLPLDARAEVKTTPSGNAKSGPAPFWLPEGERPDKTPPTRSDIAYGTNPKQVMDFWKADSSRPAPLVFFIHGGAWKSNDKDKVTGVKEYLAAGISVVSINYRLIPETTAAGIQPPVKGVHEDIVRALQFVRSKAAEWNIDKTRIGASGGSAGACSSLWLAFHDDMADPGSKDPIARESTRILCAGVFCAQTSLDPQQMKEWTPNSEYGGHAFGFNGDKAAKISSFQQFLDHRGEIMPWIREYSPYELATPGDPPVFLCYTVAPAIGKKQKDPTHTSNFGLKLHEKLKSIGVESHLMYPGVAPAPYADPVQFLIAKMRLSQP